MERRLADTAVASQGRGRRGPTGAAVSEPLERRTLLSTTVTLTGTSGNDAFLATLDGSGQNVELYVNATPATGTPVQTVALSALAGLVVNGGGGTDSLTFDAAGELNGDGVRSARGET